MLTHNYKTQLQGAALEFLQRYQKKGQGFLDKTVMGDETWVQYEDVETKEQSKQWKHSEYPGRRVKF